MRKARPRSLSPKFDVEEGKFTAPDHRDSCPALRFTRAPFVVIRRSEYHLSRDGKRGGSTLWTVFACNDRGCPAERYVRYDVLSEFVGGARGRDEEEGFATVARRM